MISLYISSIWPINYNIHQPRFLTFVFFCREVATKNWGPIADSLGNFCRKIHQRCVAAAKFTWSCHHFNDHNSGHFNCLRRCKKLSEKKASKPWELTYPTWGSSENHLQNAHSEGDMDSFPGGYIYIITIWYILMV